MVIKIKRNLSPLFYKALVSGAAQREEEHENTPGDGGRVQTGGQNARGLMERKTDE